MSGFLPQIAQQPSHWLDHGPMILQSSFQALLHINELVNCANRSLCLLRLYSVHSELLLINSPGWVDFGRA